MPHLFLVRHALPDIRPELPAHTWLLSERGRAQSRSLAEVLRSHRLSVVITSDEPKAAETGRIVAEALDLPYRSAPNLHERIRGSEPYFDELAEFEAAMRTFFKESDKRKYGGESANEAQQRFIQAVKAALEPYPDQTVVIVAHGTVNTLFVAANNEVDPFAFWKSWPLAGFAVLSRPEYTLLEGPRALG